MADFGIESQMQTNNMNTVDSLASYNNQNQNQNSDLEVSSIEVTRHLLQVGKKTEPIVSSTNLTEVVSNQQQVTNDVTSLRISDDIVSKVQMNQ